jgi:hypothetical protein
MKSKKIKDPIYNCDITIVFDCDRQEFHRWLEQKYKTVKLDDCVTIGEHINITNPNTWHRHYLWFSKSDFTIKTYGVIIHEVFHCAMDCFYEAGLKINKKTNEAFAYYQGFIFEEVLRVLLIKKGD